MSIVLNDAHHYTLAHITNAHGQAHTHTQTGCSEFTEVFRRILYRHIICIRDENQYAQTHHWRAYMWKR